jgi:phospholipase A1
MFRLWILLSVWIFSLAPAFAQGERELINLYRYKPIYFIMGSPYTKIQLSFDAQIVRDVPIYFGYTQLMMWDLFINSPLFYDINYNPLVFYRVSLNTERKEWIDLIPWEHESNGKGGDEERAWDRVGAAFNMKTRAGSRSSLYWNFKAWVPIQFNPNNPTLDQYRGVWELNLMLSDFLGEFFELNDLTLRLYPGGSSLTNPIRGGQELTLRLKVSHGPILPLVVFQVFHGYGEDLLDYTNDRWGIRAGLGF